MTKTARRLAPHATGFTLVELLVVIAILSVLMGLGAWGFISANRRLRDRAAPTTVETVIRQARNTAVVTGAPAFVEFDTAADPPRVVPWAYRVRGLWHFESTGQRTPGAFNQDAFVFGGTLVDGKIGKAMMLGDERGGFGHIECGVDRVYDCPDGGYIEAYVYWINDRAHPQYVFHKKDAYGLCLDAYGQLVGEAGLETLVGEGYPVPRRRWTKVAFAWDRRALRLFLDDAVVAVGPGTEPKVSTSSLYIGDDHATFFGIVDEARILGASPGDGVSLPPKAKLRHDAAPWTAFYFGPDGGLDPRYHAGPLKAEIQQDTKIRAVTVSMLGLTKREEVRNLTEEEVLAAEEAQKPKKRPPPPPPLPPLVPSTPEKTQPDEDGEPDAKIEEPPPAPTAPDEE